MVSVNTDSFLFMKKKDKNIIQPISGTVVPRFAGPGTFARLPELRDVESCDVAIKEYHSMQAQAIDQVQDLVLKV